MNDKELLELAAKAAGIYDEWPKPDYEVQVDGDGVFCGGMGESMRWSPLTDDGDALRLAVKLGMHVGLQSVEIWRNGKELVSFFEDGADPYAATRRAIVRAAAEIGKVSHPKEGA